MGKAQRVILNLEGGVIDCHTLPKGIIVEVRDYDICGYDPDDLSEDEGGDEYKKIEYES